MTPPIDEPTSGAPSDLLVLEEASRCAEDFVRATQELEKHKQELESLHKRRESIEHEIRQHRDNLYSLEQEQRRARERLRFKLGG